MMQKGISNLAREVDVYGYHFSWKEHKVTIIISCLAIVSVGILFRLSAIYLVILLAAAGIALPLLMIGSYKRMYEQKRFADITAYMEQMLYSFQKTGKVVSAWREAKDLYEEGMMRGSIEAAIEHVESGIPDSERGVLREAMDIIEKNYKCSKLLIVHELLAGTEENGGDVEEAIILLLEDIENWKCRGYRLQADKKKCHGDNVASILFAIILCAIALYVIRRMQYMFGADAGSIFDMTVIRVSSTIFLIFMIIVFCKSSDTLTEDWLQDPGGEDSDYVIKSYEKVTKMDNEGRRKTMSYRLAKKDVTRELYLVLPEWFMQMLLLLQNNNVQVALAKSASNAPEILLPELMSMRERMDEFPEQITTYTSFFADYDVPEIASCMKMLHAVSENGTGNAAVQMTHLLSRVHQMQDQADELNNEKIAFRMKMIFTYPVLAATVKLLVDLTVGLALMVEIMGNMGGV